MHKDENDLKLYEEHLGCQVELGHHQNEILFDKSIAELVQPRKDPAFSQHCLDECKKIIGRLKQRSEIAKDYLKSSLPIEQIAGMLGFSEASAFSNAFKTWESISPKDYRLNNR
jgi:AraC-like DNA-binding protein